MDIVILYKKLLVYNIYFHFLYLYIIHKIYIQNKYRIIFFDHQVNQNKKNISHLIFLALVDFVHIKKFLDFRDIIELLLIHYRLYQSHFLMLLMIMQ